MSENVIFNESFTDKILKIELNNLSKKNALSLEMLTEMASKLSQNNYIKKFKCVVITGTKKSAFSSGADLDDIRKLIASQKINLYHKKMDNLLKIITNLEEFKKDFKLFLFSYYFDDEPHSTYRGEIEWIKGR